MVFYRVKLQDHPYRYMTRHVYRFQHETYHFSFWNEQPDDEACPHDWVVIDVSASHCAHQC